MSNEYKDWLADNMIEDNTKDEEGNTKVYASVFKPDAEPLELLPVETEREWKIIETIITSITEESKKEKKEDE